MFDQLIKARFNDDGTIAGLLPAQAGSPVPVTLSSVSGDSASLGTLLTDWTTGGSLSVTGSTGAVAVLDSAVMCAGRPMLRVTAGAAGTMTVSFTPTTPLTVAQLKSLQFPVRFTRNSTDDGATQVFTNPTLWLVGTSGSRWQYSQSFGSWRSAATRTWSVAPGVAAQGWSFAGSPLPTSTTSMDTDTIASVRLVYVVTAADAGESIWLGPITLGARRKGKISITMDGAYISQKNYILPMLRAAGLRASLALVNKAVGSTAAYMTWADVAQYYSDGHNVLHHSYDATRINGYVNATDWPTGASITADILAGFADMTSRGFTRGNGYAVWGYSPPWAFSVGKARQDLVTNAVKAAGVKAMRESAVPGGALSRLQSIAHLDYIDPLCIQGAIQPTSTNVAADITAVVDAARDRGEWGVITLHRSVVSAPASLEMLNSELDAAISYLATEVRRGTVDCTPFDEVCALYGISA